MGKEQTHRSCREGSAVREHHHGFGVVVPSSPAQRGIGVLPEDRVRIDPEVWSQLAGSVERREAIRATYQTFEGRVSDYELHPYHLLA